MPTSGSPDTTSRTTSRPASSGACRSGTASAGAATFGQRPWTLIAGGWQISGVNMVAAGERVTLVYSPAPAFQVSSITNDFWGANNYRPNLTCDPALPADQRTITNYFNASCVAVPTDQSQPFGDAPRNNVSAPNFWQFDLAALKQVRVGSQVEAGIPDRDLQPVQPRELHAAGVEPEPEHVRDHHQHLPGAAGAVGVQVSLVGTNVQVRQVRRVRQVRQVRRVP